MSEINIKEYLIDDKRCVDVWGTASILGKSIGTVRNMTKTKGFPPHVKIRGKLYFEKSVVEEYNKGKKVIEIGEPT